MIFNTKKHNNYFSSYFFSNEKYIHLFSKYKPTIVYNNSLLNKSNHYKKVGSMLVFKHLAKTILKFKNSYPITGHITTIINKKNNSIKKFNCVRTATKSLDISHTTLSRYINRLLLNDIYLKIKSKNN
jgi:hypothetical protein